MQIENMSEYAVLAVDGGGTRCRAVLCDESGRVHGYSVGGPANYHSIGIDAVSNSLLALMQGLSGRPFFVKRAVFGLAGLDTEEDKRKLSASVMRALAEANIMAEEISLENDGMMTLIGATGGRNGMLVIAGTGSIACGITGDGRKVRVGGWGCRVGDEGSGYSIGLSALTHILRAHDGREPQSMLRDAILQKRGMADVEELFSWIYSPAFSTDAVAGLATTVCQLSEADWKARQIIDNAANELCLMAKAVIERLSLQKSAMHVVLSGGLLQQSSHLRMNVENGIRLLASSVQFAPARYEPIAGGILLGLRQLQITDETILTRAAMEIDKYASDFH